MRFIIPTFLSLSAMASPAPETDLNTLFEQIDLSREGMELIRSLAEAGDLTGAATALSEYYQARDWANYPGVVFGDSWSSKATSKLALRDDPDDVMRNTFTFLAERVSLPEDFDWCGEFMKGDPECTWWINRFFFLIVLDEETEKTGDAKYVRKGVDLMLDWIENNPVEQAAARNGAWRTLEVGLRLGNWTRFIARQIPAGNIRPEEIPILLHSLWEQTDYLAKLSGPGRGNWGFMEQCGIGLVALTFPEFKQSRHWTGSVLANMDQDIASQIYPDGSHQEMSPHYEMTVIHSVLRVLELARQTNTAVPVSLRDSVSRMVNYTAFILKPDRTLPMKNDGDAYDLTPFLAHISRNFDLPEALWIVTEGREGRRPALDSMSFPWSGLRLFRNGHDRECLYLLFDNGPFGTSHQHEDKLSIDVSAYGRHFIVDPGRYTYLDSPLRRYFLGTSSHATVRVDGMGQREAEEKQNWRSGTEIADPWLVTRKLEFAEGTYTSGYGNTREITHRRRILFVKDEYWIIEDIIEGNGQHEIDLIFTYAPGQLAVRKGGTYVTTFTDANLLLTHSSNPKLKGRIRTGQNDPTIGWYSPSYGLVEPAPHLTLSATADLPFNAYTLLLPYRGQKAPSMSVSVESVQSPAECRASGVRVETGDRVDWILLSETRSPEIAAKPKSFQGLEFSVAIAWIRTDKEGNILVTDSAGGSAPMEVQSLATFPIPIR